jgi:heme-degrading monooxygenase HmoA
METFIVTVFAKPGHEDDVAKFYRELEELNDQAEGFHGRQVFQAKNGTMVESVLRHYTEEELKAHAEAAPPDGTQFIIIEHWDSVDQRTLFSKNVSGGRSGQLFPHLLPEHSHEFYTDITPG